MKSLFIYTDKRICLYVYFIFHFFHIFNGRLLSQGQHMAGKLDVQYQNLLIFFCMPQHEKHLIIHNEKNYQKIVE